MGRVPYSEFEGSRTRFQRLSDQRIFAGWLRSMGNNVVTVTAEESLCLQSSERFLFQVQGPTADAYFIAVGTDTPSKTQPYVQGTAAAKVVEIPAVCYEFRLITQIQLRHAQQSPRKAIEAFAATLSVAGTTSEVLIADASPTGMGIIAWTELQGGDIVAIAMKSATLDARFTAEVRHCRPEPNLTGAYRVGLKFESADRLALAGWRKLINPL